MYILFIKNEMGHFIICIAVICIPPVVKFFSFIWWTLGVFFIDYVTDFRFLVKCCIYIHFLCILTNSLCLFTGGFHGFYMKVNIFMGSLYVVGRGSPQSHQFGHYKCMWKTLNLYAVFGMSCINSTHFFKDFPKHIPCFFNIFL